MSAASCAGSSEFVADCWLAETLGNPVFRLAGPPSADTALSAGMSDLAGDGNAFFYAKVPTVDVAGCLALNRAGFAVVDTALMFSWRDAPDSAPHQVSVARARAADAAAVGAIAESCFLFSRFHLDPKIPRDNANRVKRRWIENCAAGTRGSALYVARAGGEVAGFLAVIETAVEGERIAAIDLIGVSTEHQGTGIGSSLVSVFVREWRQRATRLVVGTQAANVPSLRFYERNGFRACASHYVLHAHYRDGEVWL